MAVYNIRAFWMQVLSLSLIWVLKCICYGYLLMVYHIWCLFVTSLFTKEIVGHTLGIDSLVTSLLVIVHISTSHFCYFCLYVQVNPTFSCGVILALNDNLTSVTYVDKCLSSYVLCYFEYICYIICGWRSYFFIFGYNFFGQVETAI